MRSLALCFLAVAACSPYSPDLGGAPFLCGSSAPLCPDGYACQSPQGGSASGSDGVCIKAGGQIPPDSNPTMCANDQSLEPNDSIAMAWVTPVDTRKNFPLSSLAICPEGDKDVYLVTTNAANQNIEVVISWESGLPLSGAILGGGGAMLANATANGEKSVRAYLAMAPVGTYYAQVFGGPTTKNNYSMKIIVSP